MGNYLGPCSRFLYTEPSSLHLACELRVVEEMPINEKHAPHMDRWLLKRSGDLGSPEKVGYLGAGR